jgi:biopolymer transport protein ExbD
MRAPSVFERRRGEISISMTPMIDVVFLLLIFFLWSVGTHVVEYVLPSQLAATSGTSETPQVDEPPPELDFDAIVIRVLWDGESVGWTVNDSPLESLAEVRGFLANLGKIKRDMPVILDPDPQAPLGDVIDVYDAARLERFEKIQFAASEGP